MDLSSPWFSLIPLFIFNVILLCTVLMFRPVYYSREKTHEIEDRHASKLLNRWMKEYWIWLTDPCVNFFIRVKLTPNLITTLGVVISIISGFFFARGNFGIGGWLMIFAATFDMFDGRVARLTGQVSGSGAYYDSVMDRVSEGATFIGLAFFYRHHWALIVVLLAFLGSIMVSYAKARGDASGAPYSGGAMQRPERIVYLGVGAIFAPLFSWPLAYIHDYFSYPYLFLLPLTFVAVMCWVTTYERISQVMKMLEKK